RPRRRTPPRVRGRARRRPRPRLPGALVRARSRRRGRCAPRRGCRCERVPRRARLPTGRASDPGACDHLRLTTQESARLVTTPERQTETVLASSRPRVSIGRIVVLLISLFCLYLLFPKLAEVFEAWDSLGKVDPVWVPAIAAAEFASFGCVWALQRIALRGASWFVVVTTQLAGNAFNRITPLGGATGTAFQARMLADAGVPLATAASAMTVASILGSGALGT